jgi:hypothetical protein
MGDGPLLDLDLTGTHVLVVDDDARDILDAVLSYSGALVSTVDRCRPRSLPCIVRARLPSLLLRAGGPGD